MFTDFEPGSDPRLAAVLSAARAPAELPLPGEAAALAAYRKSDGRSWVRLRLRTRPVQLLAAAIFGGVVVAGGVATAATGTLPTINVHRSQPAHTQPAVVTDDTAAAAQSGVEATTADIEMPDSAGPGSPGHQGVLGSVQKGIDTCTKASQGICQAGQHGTALAAHDHQSSPPTLPPAATQHRSGHAAGPSLPAAHQHQPSGLRAASGTTHRRG
jgi:hypothetical protein